MVSPGGALAAKMPVCQTCGGKGKARSLIYCAKCKDTAVHSYCLEKFCRDDGIIDWRCQECEPRVDKNKASKKRAKIYRLRPRKPTRKPTRSNVWRRYVSGRVVQVNQGVTQEADSNCKLVKEMKPIQDEGNPINLENGSLHKEPSSTYSFEKCESGKQLIGFPDRSDELCPLKFSQKVLGNDVSIDNSKESQVIDMNKRKGEVQNWKRVVANDVNDFDEEYQQVRKVYEGKSGIILILDESGGFAGGGNDQVLKSVSNEKLSLSKSNLEVVKSSLAVELEEYAHVINMEKGNKPIQIQRRHVLGDDNDSVTERKHRRKLILDDESVSPKEDDGISIDKFEVCSFATSLISEERVQSLPYMENQRKEELGILGENKMSKRDTIGNEGGDCTIGGPSLVSQQGLVLTSTSCGQIYQNQSIDACGGSFASQQGFSLASTSKQMHKTQCYIGAQPIRCPIWRGCLSIAFGKVEGNIHIAAHISSKASSKVFHAAVELPSLIGVDVQPKCKLWPKSFYATPPKDDCIALFLFPDHERDEEVLREWHDNIYMNNLALKATVKENVELLIFSSFELPHSYWRFFDKYYLWGVFMDKRLTRATLTCS